MMRRIRSLIEGGWLSAERGRAVKLRLLPTWGRAADGTLRPWQFAQGQLGKPEGVNVRRVPIELLDTYIGRLDPQPGRTPALITRYFDRPLLGLADLGAYAIGAIASATPTPRLRELGLVGERGPLPPRSAAELLADAEQGRLQVYHQSGPVTVAPSVQGRLRLGRVAPMSALELDQSPANGSLSGSANGSLNGSRKGAARYNILDAPEQPKRQATEPAVPTAWDSWDEKTEGMTSASTVDSLEGGGAQIDELAKRSRNTARLDPERDRLLQAIGIRNRTALAEVPLSLIGAWQTAVSHPGLRARFADPAAFAYSQLLARTPPPGSDELSRWMRFQEHRHTAASAPAAPSFSTSGAVMRRARMNALATWAQESVDGYPPASRYPASAKHSEAVSEWYAYC
jgi:hypothetical protein